MSTRELARTLLDEMPDNDLIYLVAYMQSLKALKDAEIPNALLRSTGGGGLNRVKTEHFHAV